VSGVFLYGWGGKGIFLVICVEQGDRLSGKPGISVNWTAVR